MGLVKKWNSMSLILRILIGLVIGAILGFLVPKATWIGVPGELFVGALKAIAPILVFVLVASSLANSKGGNMEKFRTVIVLYLFSTLCAAIVSVFQSGLISQKTALKELRQSGATYGMWSNITDEDIDNADDMLDAGMDELGMGGLLPTAPDQGGGAGEQAGQTVPEDSQDEPLGDAANGTGWAI